MLIGLHGRKAGELRSVVLATLFAACLSGCASSSEETSESLGTKGVFVPSGEKRPVEDAATPGGAGQPLASLAASAKPRQEAYQIGPQDVLEINVFNVPALSRVTQVSGSGTINMPLVGEVQATGKTSQQLEHELTRRLGGTFLQNPQIAISIKEYNSQHFTVEGAVKKPGTFPIRSSLTLIQSISMAEGLDKDTASSSVVVFRTENNQRLAARFDLDAIRKGDSTDPGIFDGDVVIVGTSSGKVAFSNAVKLLPLASIFKPF